MRFLRSWSASVFLLLAAAFIFVIILFHEVPQAMALGAPNLDQKILLLETRIKQFQRYPRFEEKVRSLQTQLNSLTTTRSLQLQQLAYHEALAEENRRALEGRRQQKDTFAAMLLQRRKKVIDRDVVLNRDRVGSSYLSDDLHATASLPELPEEKLWVEYGQATFYSDSFEGKKMASGGPFSNSKINGIYYAAHKTAPFATQFKVTSIVNGASVTVVIGDRGPFVAFRIIDLPRDAFAEIAPLSRGIINVKIEEIPQE